MRRIVLVVTVYIAVALGLLFGAYSIVGDNFTAGLLVGLAWSIIGTTILEWSRTE